MNTTRQLAERLGVAPSLVASLRSKLQTPDHWLRDPEDGRRILWTAAGESAVLDALGLTPSQEEPQSLDVPPFDTCAELPPTRLECQVSSVPRPKPGCPHYPNEHIIQVRAPDRRLFHVWVRSSRNFQPQLQGGAPMLVTIEQRGSRWELAEQRCPRWPGKW